MNVFRLAVASDLHAYGAEAKKASSEGPSSYDITSPIIPSGQHPIAALNELIRDNALQADVLACPGDLADKAEPMAVDHAWKSLNEIAHNLRAELFTTPGNHDLDSRYNYNKFDAKGKLQTLNPRFPFSNEHDFDRFWSRHFISKRIGEVRILTLNSSAFHGARMPHNAIPVQPDGHEHGRISPYTHDAIKNELLAADSSVLNILLCHHHPQPLEEHGLGAHDVMMGGMELLRLLGEHQCGEWFVVHGHKHYPKISYAQAETNSSPIVFSAGSLCVRLHREISDKAKNQFYIIEFPLDEIPSNGLVGTFKAWDWSLGNGWIPAQERSGLPHTGGFGCKDRVNALGKAVEALFETSDLTKRWTEIESSVPQIRYLFPKDWKSLLAEVERRGFRVLRDADGSPFQVDRRT